MNIVFDPAPTVVHWGSQRIHELDGLRGLLALFVVCFHLLAPVESLSPFLAFWCPIFLQGWYAVDVFFVMSGFVMMHVYGEQFLQRVTWCSFLQFMRARIARLYPVHVFAMLVTLAGVSRWAIGSGNFFSFSGRYSLGALVESLFMLHSPWMEYLSWNYPAWSISAEWHAYLVFPLLVPLFHRLSLGQALTLVMAGVAIPFWVYQPGVHPHDYPTNGLLVLARVLPLFLTGMSLYSVYLKIKFFSTSAGSFAVLGTLLALWISPSAAVLLVPLLVLCTLRNPGLRAIFASSPLIWLGKISYSLYMTHALIEGFVLGPMMRLASRESGLDLAQDVGYCFVFWLVGILLSVALGWVTWRWVELPCRDILMRGRYRAYAVR